LPVINGTVNGLPDQRFATFLTNHDQTRVGAQVGGDVDRLRGTGMLLLSLPGTPFIYYGEEIGMHSDKPDPRIRTPMQLSADASGGFTAGIPWEPLQPGWEEITVAAQANDPASLLATYRAWGQLREQYPSLQMGEYIPVTSDDASMVSLVRRTDEETLLVVINLGSNPTEGQVLTAPEGITGATTDLFSGEASARIAADAAITVPALAGWFGTVLRVETAGE
jgi:glycosidase